MVLVAIIARDAEMIIVKSRKLWVRVGRGSDVVEVGGLRSVYREPEGDDRLLFAIWAGMNRRSLEEENMFDLHHHVTTFHVCYGVSAFKRQLGLKIATR